MANFQNDVCEGWVKFRLHAIENVLGFGILLLINTVVTYDQVLFMTHKPSSICLADSVYL